MRSWLAGLLETKEKKMKVETSEAIVKLQLLVRDLQQETAGNIEHHDLLDRLTEISFVAHCAAVAESE
jgi:hypothetical protein